MMAKIKARKGRNGAEYNGGISSVQMNWLQSQLNEAQQRERKYWSSPIIRWVAPKD